MSNRLFLLDGMALVYRAHFAFAQRPIINSSGMNVSAVFGFTNTLLELLENQKPTHLGVVFDTSAPTERHKIYPEYKAQREAMPEDLKLALPHVKRIVEAFNIPVLELDGYEADDIIGTLVKRAEKRDMDSWMVTPDKDFCQLVSDRINMYRPGRKGGEVEIMGLKEVLEKWEIERPEQVIDILGLWGDSVDNIPGIPGIGEKTAKKLVAKYGSVEGLIEHSAELKGKQKENLIEFADQGKLSKFLATINLEVPIEASFEDLKVTARDDESLKALCAEFEFSGIGKRLFGKDFVAGRSGSEKAAGEEATPPKTIKDVEHEYALVNSLEACTELALTLSRLKSFCFDIESTGLDTKTARIIGVAFSWEAHRGTYVALPGDPEKDKAFLEVLRPVLEAESIEKVGHNLKYDISILGWAGLDVKGPIFDTMLAHSLIDPDQRHSMDFLSELYLNYTPISISALIGEKKSDQISMALVPIEEVVEYAVEDSDVTWQLKGKLEPLLKETGQEKIFYEIEIPLIPVLIAMEKEGIRVDVDVLKDISIILGNTMKEKEAFIYEAAGEHFNLNSPKQLGQILFEKLALVDKPKKTKTGQYATNEQTLMTLAHEHEIIQIILDFRAATKLKSTYADALPGAVFRKTERVHTTYNQLLTATGRLQSQDPNLQNIPIRTEMGREIRRAFVARDENHLLLAADYSQIELRIIASISGDSAMREAFESGHDIHTATAARVYGLPMDEVITDMRRNAKMVNFGIAYGISAFGLAQRLRISRREAAELIEEYFKQYPGIQKYMKETVELAQSKGYVETLAGRRRYLRDINSRNGTVRSSAERNAINSPIQGAAADMIKIAMIRVQRALVDGGFKTKMLLQVHDELVFDMPKEEEETVRPLVVREMVEALPLNVPVVVETGVGQHWLEAH
ncbi:DNA polymerase I [Verrucomicrobia bacterium]|nr:DNA polymerase I [Verrucomicrobiota bacterium]